MTVNDFTIYPSTDLFFKWATFVNFIATLCNYWIIILLFIVFVSFVFLSLPYNTKRIETTVVVIQHFVNKTELNY